MASVWQRASASLSICFLSVFGTGLGVQGLRVVLNQTRPCLQPWKSGLTLETEHKRDCSAAKVSFYSSLCSFPCLVSLFPSAFFSRRRFFMSFFVFCQRKRDKSHNMQLSEGNEKERGSIASAQIQSVTRKQATVCHQTFGILSGSSDKFHQGQPVIPCNFPLQALSASSLFLHLVELNTCEVRPGPLLVQRARVSLSDGDRGSGTLMT